MKTLAVFCSSLLFKTLITYCIALLRIRFICCLILIFLSLHSVMNAQQNVFEKKKDVLVVSDTIQLDTLSLVPGSLVFPEYPSLKPDSLFQIDYSRSLLIIKPGIVLPDSQIALTYKTFPYNFSRKFFHKNPNKYISANQEVLNPFLFRPNESVFEKDFEGITLQRSGSISRGISVGNNQNMGVSSSFNLQLSGKLNQEVGILAAVTDDNIPVQPDGNTQQLQEFDKIYIQLFTSKSRLVLGDFELQKPPGYFMQFSKKGRGAFGYALTEYGEKKQKMFSSTSACLSVSKGRFARNTLNVIEGNQGPYRLTGSNNETFIIVLAGTERVYMDGELLTRGQEFDYVIDYNTAEIRFTPKRPVTREKRIIVEFEYADRNYSRSMVFLGEELKTHKAVFRFNYFSEQDMKNQPLQQELSDADKQLLSQIGDSLSMALVPGWDSLPYSADEIRYKMIDSLGFDSVFVYSTHPDSAFYRVSFSFVGAGKGHYVLAKTSANGKVFQWVAPVGGQPQGSYSPYVLLAAPQKKQLITVGTEISLSHSLQTGIEWATSVQDLNTFSEQGNNDNKGQALTAWVQGKHRLGSDSLNSWNLLSKLVWEFTDKRFQPVERYRNVEFERDWNLKSYFPPANEHHLQLKLNFQQKKRGYINWMSQALIKAEQYKGIKNGYQMRLTTGKWRWNSDASLVQTSETQMQTQFFRQKSQLSSPIQMLLIGIKSEQEDNRLFSSGNDSLKPGSYSFFDFAGFIGLADTSKVNVLISAGKRSDFFRGNSRLRHTLEANYMDMKAEWTVNQTQQLKTYACWRQVEVLDTLLTQQKPSENFTGRLEYNVRMKKGLLLFNTYWETGSGMEVKKDFVYLEVNPGQGVFAWNDYNGDGIKQLNEFEIAAFKDQANYVRIFIPTGEYVKTWTKQFSQSITLQPAAVWAGKTGWKAVLAKFSGQLSLKTDEKTQNNSQWNQWAIPSFSSINDSQLVSLNNNLRTAVFFNRNSNVFGADWQFFSQQNKTLMVNGFESRNLNKHNLNTRWNINKFFQLTNSASWGIKNSSSEFFSVKDYSIDFREAEPSLSYQPDNQWRISVSYRYNLKKNTLITSYSGNEKSFLQRIQAETRINRINKGSVLMKAAWIGITYNAASGSALAYEMLEGFLKGNNINWSVGWQRNLTERLQLNFQYEGRKSEKAKAVHTGTIQLRAYF